MPSYTSKDFGKTERSMKADVPEKLIHENVEGSVDEKFSG